MKKLNKWFVAFIMFFVVFKVSFAFSATAEVEALFNESIAAAEAYERALETNPLAAAAAANAIMEKLKAMSAEDQAAYAAKLGFAGPAETIAAIRSNFIDRAYETQWNKLTADWTKLMEEKKYDEARNFAVSVADFLSNNAASLPGIGDAALDKYKILAKKGIEISSAHDEAAAKIAELSALYSGKKYKDAVEKLQQLKTKADKTPAFADAIKKLVPEAAADFEKFCGDLLKTVVKDYAEDQVKKYRDLFAEGKTKEASKLAGETAEFLKNNPQAKEIVDAEYGVNGVMICEKARLDSYFVINQDLKNAMEMYPEFKAAVESYDRLCAAKDFLGAAKLASEWVKKCKNDPVFKGANEAGKGVLLEMCSLGLELALVSGIDQARNAYIEAYAKGDMAAAKRLADEAAGVLSALPEYKDIINKKLGGDWEKIAKEASAKAAANETAVRNAKTAVLAETCKQLAGLYSAEVSVNGAGSAIAQALKQALVEFARQNAQYMAEIEKVSGIKLDSLTGVQAQDPPAGDGEDAAATERRTTDQSGRTDGARQSQAGQSGVPPVTNQSEGTNQPGGSPFTTGSGN